MIRAWLWVVGAVASGALLLPAGAAAHLAYVDQETGSGSVCEQDNPCATIAQGIATVETGLAVIVDDSATPYAESLSLGDGKTLLAQDFVDGSEVQWTIDGEAAAAVEVLASGAGAISGFALRSNANAVRVQGAVNITANTFDDPDQSATGDVEVLTPGSVSITSNEFTDTDSLATDTAIRIANGASSASLSRNAVTGYTTAVAVDDTTGPVTLAGDLLVANGMGLALSDAPPTWSGQGDVSATNVTFASNDTDISNTDADLTLDSSIVEDPITATGTATCLIDFSRGPVTGTGCDDFDTTADPGLVNPGGGNFHLAASSAMIDAGNPNPPAVPNDIDGDPRAVDGDGVCPPVRDIGADEFVPAGPPLDCSPPPEPEPQSGDTSPPDTVIDSGPSARTKSKLASFTFHSTEPGSSFQCRLDGGSFAPCSSPKTYDKLKKGPHTLEIRATDAAGNADPTPATRSWTVKKKKKCASPMGVVVARCGGRNGSVGSTASGE